MPCWAPVLFTKGFYLPDIRSDPDLCPIFAACERSPVLRKALAETIGSTARLLGPNELLIDMQPTWHRDKLQGCMHHMPDCFSMDGNSPELATIG